MTIELMKLPFAADALEPAISAETLKTHHGKHHKAYVEKTNALASEVDLGDADLETIIRAASKSKNTKLLNQAAQVWNHGFYWMSLTSKPAKPDADLSDRLDANFGPHDEFLDQFAAAATDHFGSGWAWLMMSAHGKLAIETTHDAGCPVVGSAIPLLTVDVWEHAYYLDRKNDRKAYVKAILTDLLNWEFAAANLASGELWTYPA